MLFAKVFVNVYSQFAERDIAKTEEEVSCQEQPIIGALMNSCFEVFRKVNSKTLEIEFFFKSKSYSIADSFTAWNVSKYGVFSGVYFPAFGLNTER